MLGHAVEACRRRDGDPARDGLLEGLGRQLEGLGPGRISPGGEDSAEGDVRLTETLEEDAGPSQDLGGRALDVGGLGRVQHEGRQGPSDALPLLVAVTVAPVVVVLGELDDVLDVRGHLAPDRGRERAVADPVEDGLGGLVAALLDEVPRLEELTGPAGVEVEEAVAFPGDRVLEVLRGDALELARHVGGRQAEQRIREPLLGRWVLRAPRGDVALVAGEPLLVLGGDRAWAEVASGGSIDVTADAGSTGALQAERGGESLVVERTDTLDEARVLVALPLEPVVLLEDALHPLAEGALAVEWSRERLRGGLAATLDALVALGHRRDRARHPQEFEEGPGRGARCAGHVERKPQGVCRVAHGLPDLGRAAIHGGLHGRLVLRGLLDRGVEALLGDGDPGLQ